MSRARSRGSSGRTVCEPMGNLSHESVRTGNYIAVRTLIVLIIVAALQCWTILEQPKNSIMELHPAFQQYLSIVQCWRAHIQMRDFGGPTAKPTWLYSNRRMIGELHEFRPLSLPAPTQPIEMVVRYTDSSGRSKIKGGRHLKQSQSYPKGFLVIFQIAAVGESCKVTKTICCSVVVMFFDKTYRNRITPTFPKICFWCWVIFLIC